MEHDPQARWMAAMRAGDFDAAHVISDAVLAARDPAGRDDPNLPYHMRWVWDGRAIDARHVLVRCYHGLGDTVQFARFLPLLAQRAASVHVEAPPALLPLLALVPGPDLLIPFRPALPAKARECDIEIMELLHALRVRSDAIPPPSDLRVPPFRIGTRAIGLCWTAGEWDPSRSVPLADLLLACAGSRMRLVSLQRGAAAEAALASRFINPGDNNTSLIRSAGLIMGLDLVITVDTMIAHLAGTLGVPVCVLLRRHADWRWMEGRRDSPWYPSMRLYRQETEGDWGPPLRRLGADLRRLAAG
jgi:ADP-heptose:LPS heptosyltransferase